MFLIIHLFVLVLLCKSRFFPSSGQDDLSLQLHGFSRGLFGLRIFEFFPEMILCMLWVVLYPILTVCLFIILANG